VARIAFDALFPGRFRVAGLVLAGFMLLGLATRIGLAVFNGVHFDDWSPFAPQRLAGWLVVGTLFDLGIGAWVALPFAVLAWLAPGTPRGAFALRWVALPLTVLLAGGLVFVAAAEFVFWNEFGTRFNFNAVDYLVYTGEVIGNSRQSYSMPLLLAAVGLAALALLALGARPLWRATRRMPRCAARSRTTRARARPSAAGRCAARRSRGASSTSPRCLRLRRCTEEVAGAGRRGPGARTRQPRRSSTRRPPPSASGRLAT
jgi:hypothetical protein